MEISDIKEVCRTENTEYKQNFFQAISNGDKFILKKLIGDENFPFWSYYDDEGSTGLIKATFLNITEISLILIEEAKVKMLNEEFAIWINHKAGENGFSSLLYAAFRGNIILIESLISNGADINIRNNNGLNVMHMAAQGNQPNVLVYFKEKHNMQINICDNVQSTPLHWACYMGSESCLDYLNYWETEINCKDKEGFTPLHLAVMTEKTKIIRKLIMSGADINIEDHKQRKAIDIAIKRNNLLIVELLKDNVQFLTCKLAVKKADNQVFFPLGFFIYMLLIDSVLGVLVLPHFNSLYNLILIMGLTIALFGVYIRLFFSDPGWKKNRLNKTLLQLAVEGEQLNKICPWCVVKMNPSTRHCYYCNKCVENIDHHCVWLKNCISTTNFTLFFFFLLLLAANLIINVVFAIESLFLVPVDDMKKNFLKFSKIEFLYSHKIKNISSIFEIFFGIIVLVPVLCLLLTHVKVFYKGSARHSLKNQKNKVPLIEEEKNLLNK